MTISRERMAAGQWTPPWLRFQHETRYQWAASFCTDADVLDAACANGYGSRSIGRAGARRVVGVELALEPLREAGMFERVARVQLVRGDATRLPLADHSVDVFVSFETIEHIPDDAAYVREARRVLRSGGVFLCSTPNRTLVNAGNALTDRPFNPYHVREYTRYELDQVLRPSFAEVEWYGQTRYPRGYASMLAGLSKLARMTAVRAHQMRKLIGMPFESRWKHEPYALSDRDEPEVLIAVCR